ncbi:unannotated protein [freshwater metagenome]|uniref:Unannotated protein n=1 Tax=freshwater metagenome TaxID=449393 RepID=A0A6J7TEU4_9ZZZZ
MREVKSDAMRIAVAFARVLRGAGVSVPISRVLGFAEGIEVIGIEDRDAVYWTGRATLLHRPEDNQTYDRAFKVFWEWRGSSMDLVVELPTIDIQLAVDSDDEEGGDGPPPEEDESDTPTIHLRFSATEILREKDFALYSQDELREAQTLMSDLRLVGTPRRSRRLVSSRRRGARPDLRRTVRAALRAGGEPIDRAWREPGEKLRRLVLLLDVSGSMEPYARALVRFVHAAVAGRQKVEAFTLGTRLTRVTRELNSRDPDRAMQQAANRVADWSGGTRLGEGFRQFNDEWGVRGMARGAIIVVLSDGWDRGEPEVLAAQMERLHRVAYKVVWVNPLKVTPGYAPLARGMAAALPYVDDFVEGHSVDALEELARVISHEIGPKRTGMRR